MPSATLSCTDETACEAALSTAMARNDSAPPMLRSNDPAAQTGLRWQQCAGNAAVSRMLAARRPGAPPAARAVGRPGGRCACGGTIGADGLCDRCRAAQGKGEDVRGPVIRRSILDDIGDAASSGVDAVSQAASSAGQAVADGASEAAGNAGEVTSGIFDAPGEAAAGVADVAGQLATGIVNGAADVASGLADDSGEKPDEIVDPEMEAWRPVAVALQTVAPQERRKLLNQTVLLHGGGGDDELRTAVGLPVAGQIASPQGGCVASACPVPAEQVPAVYPVWQQAELCIQSKYDSTHSGNTIGHNKRWVTLVGRDPAERRALDCLRRDFTAKSGMAVGEPDLWDFSNRTMYEITTPSGASFRKGKLAAEIALANKLTGGEECGGTLYSAGTWVPPGPCLYIGHGLWAQVVNESGVLVYTAWRRGRPKEEPEPQPAPWWLPLVILIGEGLRRVSAPRPPVPVPVTPILIPERLLKCLGAPDIERCMNGTELGA